MAHLTDLDLTAPADSLFSGGTVLNTWRTRIDALNDILGDITTAEANQVENIAATTISAAQWAYVGALDQGLTTTSTVTFGTINAFTLGGKLTAGAVEIEGSAFDINGGTIDGITSLTAGGNLDIGAHGFTANTLTADGLTATRIVYAGSGGLLSGVAELTWSKPTLTINCPSETAAGNALWIDLRSTVTNGDLTGIRSRVYGNAASAGANVRGGYLEAKMAAAGKKAAMLEGALFHADYSPGSITVSGDVRGFTAHISQGSGLNAANLFGGLINIQTRGDETITTDDIGLMIRNEAVGGSGRTMDTGLKITDLNMGGGTNGFTYGIDLNGVGIATADIRFSGGQVITSSATLLTMPAIALTDVTMSLDSDADGDIYYRSSNKLTRLAKGTEDYVLTMGESLPAWAAATGAGAIDISGVPVTNDYARWTDADTLEGREVSEVFTDLGLAAALANLTTTEITELEAIGDTTISSTQWGYLGALTKDPLGADGTAGRVLRVASLTIDNGTNNTTLKCTLVNNWNGDTIAVTDNIIKNDTTGDFTLSSTGKTLLVEASGLTGNCVSVSAFIRANFSGTALTAPGTAVSNDIQLQVFHTTTGVAQDMTTLVDTGAIYVEMFYVTDE